MIEEWGIEDHGTGAALCDGTSCVLHKTCGWKGMNGGWKSGLNPSTHVLLHGALPTLEKDKFCFVLFSSLIIQRVKCFQNWPQVGDATLSFIHMEGPVNDFSYLHRDIQATWDLEQVHTSTSLDPSKALNRCRSTRSPGRQSVPGLAESRVVKVCSGWPVGSGPETAGPALCSQGLQSECDPLQMRL